MSNVVPEPDWIAVAEAMLREEYPLLPTPLPHVITSLLPVWAERIATMDPTVRQEQLGAYSVTYGGASASFLTPADEVLLRRYRYPRYGSPVTSGPSEEAAVEAGIALGEV